MRMIEDVGYLQVWVKQGIESGLCWHCIAGTKHPSHSKADLQLPVVAYNSDRGVE